MQKHRKDDWYRMIAELEDGCMISAGDPTNLAEILALKERLKAIDNSSPVNG